MDAREKMLLEVTEKTGINRAAEVGVLSGDHAELMHRVLKPDELHLIDYWGEQPKDVYSNDSSADKSTKQYLDYMRETAERFTGSDNTVILHKGLFHDVARSLKSNYFDFVYIDGNHRRDAVLQDLKDALRITREGGVLAGHDIGGGFQGVEGAVQDFSRVIGSEVITHGINYYMVVPYMS